jgi:ferrous iron transport protein B
MELPAYHMPRPGAVLRSMWERGWSFIKKAGTIILLSTVVLWFLMSFGFPSEGGFGMLAEEDVDRSVLACLGRGFAWIFAPLGFGAWSAAVATITGLIAKENIVGTLSIVFGSDAGIAAAVTRLSGFAFLIFNLLCAPCFAAIGAIRREMRSGKWTAFAVGYQCGFAWLVSFTVNQLGALFGGVTEGAHWTGGVLAILLLLALVLFLAYPTVRRRMRKELD